MTVPAALLILTWAVPLVFGLLYALRIGALVPLAALAALPGLLTALLVPIGTAIEIPAMLLGTQFALDETGQRVLFFSALLWLAASIFALGYMRTDDARPTFFIFFLLAMAGNLGLILAGDMMSFYTFFALMSFASYGLIIHTRKPDVYYAGYIYIVLVVIGEVLLFAGLVLMATSSGTFILSELAQRPIDSLSATLVFISFGIKAGVVILHLWLPLAHPAAPIPASAVLSGAMIKAGLLGWLRFLNPAEPTGWGELIIVLGLVTAFYGAVIGVSQVNPKTVLAYSSISQMGFIMVGVGAWLLSPTQGREVALIAIALYAASHGLAKGALFLGVAFAGASRLVPLLLLLPALALAGLPLTSGAVAKTALKSVTDGLPVDWAGQLTLPLSLAAVGTTLLMARFLWLIWHSPAPQKGQPRPVWLVWFALLGCVAALFFLLPDAATPLTDSLKPDKLWPAIVPILAGAGIAAGAVVAGRYVKVSPMPFVPAGDLVYVFAALTRRLRASAEKMLQGLAQTEQRLQTQLKAGIDLSALRETTAQLELRLRQDWLVAGGTILITALAILLFAWLAF